MTRGSTYTIFPLSRPRSNPDYYYANVSNGNAYTMATVTNVTVVSKLILDSQNGLPLANVGVVFPTYPVDGSTIQITSTVNVSNCPIQWQCY
jgi:hypothetical protein